MLTTSRTSKSVTNTNSQLYYHPHKTFNFSDKGIPSLSVSKPQMKLEWKDSMDIHQENFELRKSWLDYSIFVSCFCLSLQSAMVERIWINTKIQFCCSYNLETYRRIYLWVISVSFLHFPSLIRLMKSQWLSLLIKSSFLKIRLLIKSEIHMLVFS